MTFQASTRASSVVWVGRILSGLVIVFLLLDGAIKLVPLKPVIDTMQGLGFNTTPALARGLGILLLVCTVLYAAPKTSLLGALLLTGYLGGAIAINLRAGTPLFSHLLFSVYIGIFLWAGLLIRNSQIRSLLFPSSWSNCSKRKGENSWRSVNSTLEPDRPQDIAMIRRDLNNSDD